jgi:hypothetical protein
MFYVQYCTHNKQPQFFAYQYNNFNMPVYALLLCFKHTVNVMSLAACYKV